MAAIGAFTRSSDGSYKGAIRTLVLNLKQVVFQPIRAETPNAPDFRILSAGVEIGAAWKKVARDGGEYHSVRLDDPTLVAPVYATLIEVGDGFALIWSRRIAD
jgi:uncharacterized protein (DUF736 family)